MRSLILGRLAWFVPSLIVVSFLVFALADIAPGDAAARIAGEQASLADIERVRERLGLDQPLFLRFGEWLVDAARFDFQQSLLTNEPVSTVIMRALPKTLSLAAVAFAFSCAMAMIAGCLAASRPDTLIDRGVTLAAALGVVLPSFVVSLFLVSRFALTWSWFPATGYVGLVEDPRGWIHHLVLPAFALSTITAGELARQLRGSLRDEMSRSYVLTAQAKGLPPSVILFKHALKNAAIPVVTVAGVRFGQIIGGTIVVEQIFAIRGIGTLMINAARGHDVPIILGVVVIATFLVFAMSLIVDLTYGYLNPKLRR